MHVLFKRLSKKAGWALSVITAAGFGLALPGRSEPVKIDELSLTSEEANPFDRSVHVGMDAEKLLELRNSVDTTTPNMVISDTNVDTVTPSMIISSTSVDTTTPSMVISSTSVDTTTPSMVISSTNVMTTTPNMVISGGDPAKGGMSFFPNRARLPEPKMASGVEADSDAEG